MNTNRNLTARKNGKFSVRKLTVKIIATLLAAIFIVPMVAALPDASASAETHDATLSSHEVWVNGWKTDIRGYLIYGMNFVHLRDIGRAFDIHIDYEAATRTIVIDTREPYAGAASAVANLPQTAVATKAIRYLRLNGNDRVGMDIYPGGILRDTSVYMINGSSYLGLAQVAGMLDIGVAYDATARRVNFDTTVGLGFGNGNMKTLDIPLPRVKQRDGSTPTPTVPNVPAAPSAPSTPSTPSKPSTPSGSSAPSVQPDRPLTGTEAETYMLSAEYVEAVRTEFYRLLNEHRVANGLRELAINLELQAYADVRADELRIRFEHTRPDGTAAGSGWYNSGNAINTRYAENGTGVRTLNTDPKAVANRIFTNWSRSPNHNRHMLYSFDSRITMAFGFAPKLNSNGSVESAAIFATGY